MLLIPTCQRRSQVAVAAAIAVAAFLVAPTWAMAHTTSTLPASTADLLAKGGQLSPDGRWIHMPDGVDVSATPATLSDCTSGHVCLFDNANFVGTMLMFSAPGLYNLTDYDFNDRMSSWANNSGVSARWFYDIGGGGASRCMSANTTDPYVGSADNDKASSIQIYTGSNAC